MNIPNMEHLDALGGLLIAQELNQRVFLTVSEGAVGRNLDPLPTVAHVLDVDDAVGLAHWLLRQAAALGDPRPEVMAALVSLRDLADREEAQSQ